MVNLQPPGEDGTKDLYVQATEAAVAGTKPADGQAAPEEPLGRKLLRLVAAAETSAERYTSFTRKSWNRAYRAYRNQHFEESKYNSKEYAARSKIFRPKTRSAVRKMMASTAASLFSTVDALAIQPGNEADATSRAGAALMQEVVNYRTDRTSGRNAIPWFKCAMGAVQDAWLTGICASKQYWKLQTKQVGEQPAPQVNDAGEPVLDATGQPVPQMQFDEASGAETPVMQPVLKAVFDRPDCVGIPPENVIIDSGADWTDPAQSAAFLIIKWPMKLDDVRQREKDPRDPWKHLSDSQLRGTDTDRATANSQGIRNSREGGVDRFDQTNNTNEFSTVWVYEAFVRANGEDYTFFCVRSQHLLTDPRPVDDVYPWNDGERPIIIGYGSLESHKIFPMSPAEGLQQLQSEINDLANLTLDTVKMNVSPVAKVKRGRQVDLDALRKRAPGTNLLMTALDDVEFEKPPGPDASAFNQMERLNVDFDDLAGQFNAGSVQTNRQLNETVGGMRLISGAANALQEFDQRVLIETWAEPALGQIVRLCQYYEHDQTILGLCGERAKLWEKHGVDQITDEMLDAQITTRIDVGVGAGDPQQRITKFQMAVGAVLPLLQGNKKFQSGEYEIDADAIMQEAFGAAGYRDGGQRFLKKNPPPQQGPTPQEQLALRQLLEEINQKRAQGDLQRAQAYAAIKKVGLDELGMLVDLMADERAAHQDQQAQQQQPQAQPAPAGPAPGGAAPSIDPQRLALLLKAIAAHRSATPPPPIPGR